MTAFHNINHYSGSGCRNNTSRNAKHKLKINTVADRLCYSQNDSITLDLKQSENILKERIKILEKKNIDLQFRLDSLRKAKNQLIIKRDTRPQSNFIQSRLILPSLNVKTNNNLDSLDKGTILEESFSSLTKSELIYERNNEFLNERDDLLDKLKEMKTYYEHQLVIVHDNLIEEHETEIKQLSDENTKLINDLETLKIRSEESLKDYNSKEDKLLQQIEKLENNNINSNNNIDLQIKYGKLCSECESLQLKFDALLSENSHLSELLKNKQEDWKMREEELSLEIRKAWGERYHEWITKAEKKMKELHEMNRLLQSLLDKNIENIDAKKFNIQ